MLKLVSLRLGCDEAGFASGGKTVSWVQLRLREGTACAAVQCCERVVPTGVGRGQE